MLWTALTTLFDIAKLAIPGLAAAALGYVGYVGWKRGIPAAVAVVKGWWNKGKADIAGIEATANKAQTDVAALEQKFAPQLAALQGDVNALKQKVGL